MRIPSSLALVLVLASIPTCARDVRIGVFGLFHPRELRLAPGTSDAVILHAGTESLVLEASTGHSVANLTISPSGLVLQVGDQSMNTSEMRATNRSGGPVDLTLSVPGKITRRYRGILDVTMSTGLLVLVVSMDLETAVASVVQAEAMPDTPLEALKAQAVATRSYLVAASGRHHEFDFCDTTHCQFLRDVPASQSPAAIATAATRGLILAYQEKPLAAMFTRSCSGRTRTPAEVQLTSQNYPYFAVVCDYCRRNPFRWRSQVSLADAEVLASHTEEARLKVGRMNGWSVVPSDAYTIFQGNSQAILEGTGEGHGIGMCQRGAKAMAETGSTFRQILSHYYPETRLVELNEF